MSHADPIKTPGASGGSFPLRDWTAWRDLLLRAGVGLLTIFVGVTAAFFFDGYREQLERGQKLKDARRGIIAELKNYELGGAVVVDDIDKSLASWKQASAAGTQAVPGYYVMTGSPRPPTAAWTSAVASGVAGNFDPDTQLGLGYFYSEYFGVHDSYVRRLEFTEQEILPRALTGASTFYDPGGRLLPQFQVHMDLLGVFSTDLRRLNAFAKRLRVKLEVQASDP